MHRPICNICKKNYAEINYIKFGLVHYRSRCSDCIRKKRKPQTKKLWEKGGYKKKNICGRCGFHSEQPAVFSVYFVDGNLRNVKPNNLTTVCANCQILLLYTKTQWVPGDIIADF